MQGVLRALRSGGLGRSVGLLLLGGTVVQVGGCFGSFIPSFLAVTEQRALLSLFRGIVSL